MCGWVSSRDECLLDSGLLGAKHSLCLAYSAALRTARGSLSPQTTEELLGFILHFEH